MEGGTWPGSLGKSRGASERGGDELEWPGDGHSKRMVVGGGTWILAVWSRPPFTAPAALILF